MATLPRITSRRNPLLARYRAAAEGSATSMLLDGAHLVGSALAARVPIEFALVREGAIEEPEIAELLRQLNGGGRGRVAVAPPQVMQVASPLRSPSAIVALAARPTPSGDRLYAGPRPTAVGVFGVQDPGNLGAIARVAEAGGASGLVAADGTADPFGWKALRGSMGSLLRLPVSVHRDGHAALDEARAYGCRLLAAVPRDGRSLFEVPVEGPLMILIGGEGAGLPADIVAAADERVSIPMDDPVESLNAAVAAALIVYEVKRRRSPDELGRRPRTQSGAVARR
jgi:TrmH family RNA methyltransferase